MGKLKISIQSANIRFEYVNISALRDNSSSKSEDADKGTLDVFP